MRSLGRIQVYDYPAPSPSLSLNEKDGETEGGGTLLTLVLSATQK